MADNLADMKKRCLPNKKYLSGKNHLGTIGAGDGGRTHTVSPPTDFESVSSANSNTPAYDDLLIISRIVKNVKSEFYAFRPCGVCSKILRNLFELS